MGRPPTHGAPSFRFFAAEVAQMETLLREHNGHVPPRELLMSLANKFSNSVERSGKSAVQMKQVWNWFQNRRYALRSKLVKPTTNSTIPPNPRDDAAQVRNVPPVPQQAHQPSGHNVVRNTSENPPMEFEAKSARDGAWYDVQAFLSHRYLETGNPEVLVRFSGFGPEEDEWLNVRRLVRQRSLPCESTECVAVLPTDLILCFQEGKEQALYFDAHVLDAQRRRHDVRGCRCRFLVRYDHDQTEEIVPLRKICRRPETDYRLQQLHAANESASASTSTSVSAESRRPVADPNLINSARVANPNPNPSAAVTVPPPTITNVSAQSLISPPSSSSTLASASTISSTLAAPNPSLAPISAPTPSPTSISAPTPSPSLISAASPSSTHSAPTPSQTLKSAPSPSLTTISAPTPSSTSIFAPSPSSTPNFAPTPSSTPNFAPTPSSTPNFAPTPTLIPTPSSSTPLSGPTPSPALISAPSSSTQFSEALISAPSSSTQFSDASPSLTPAPAPSLTLISSSSTSPTLTSAPSQTPMSAPSPKLISAQTSTLISTTTPIPAPASAPNVSPILAPAPSLAPVPTSLTPDAAPDSKKFEGDNSGASVEDISTGVASIVVEAKKNEIGVTPETSMVTESSISQEELSGNPTVPVAEPKKVGNLAPSESTMVVSCFSADGEPTVSTVVESSNLTVSDDKE